MSDRALAARHIAARAQSFHRVGSVYRLVYGSAALKMSAHNSHIPLINITRKPRRRVAVQGADNNAGRALVEPADAAKHRALSLAFQVPRHRVCERVALVVVGRVHGKKRRFVDGEQICVLVYYIYIYVDRLDSLALRGQRHRDHIARVQAVYGSERLASAGYAAVDAL